MAHSYIGTTQVAELDVNGFASIAGLMKIYNFDRSSGEYIGSCIEYLPVGISIPAHSTIIEPDLAASGFINVFNQGKWQPLADHRGETVYSLTDGSASQVTLPGEYPANTTVLKPATIYDQWDGTRWVTDNDAQKAAQIADADVQKNSLVDEANRVTQAWQTQLALNMISDADRETLTVWMKYIQALQAVDTSLAPDIHWPENPA